MNINIKEIFESDLDPNSTAWWSNDKIDKINYNFGQVSTDGIRGPQGYIGIDGDPGAIGSNGATGFQGSQGNLGPQGAIGITLWDYVDPTAVTKTGYLFPKRNSATIIQYAPPVMEIGISNTSTGYNNPATYTDYVVLSNVNLSSPTPTPPTPIKKIETNLRLQTNTTTTDHYADMQLNSPTSTLSTLKIGRISNASPGLKMIFSSKIVSHITDALTHRLTSINATVYKSADVKKAGVINQNMKYLPSTADPTNKILVSVDGIGKIHLKDLQEVYPTYPIGSIISIREEEFNDTNFYLDETITQDLTVSPLPVLDNRFGRGKANGQFAGWYLCNGLYWVDPNAVLPPIQTQTPNLNSFTYTIASNGGSQSQVSVGANEYILIGGVEIKTIAEESNVTFGNYNVYLDAYTPINNLANGPSYNVGTGTQYQRSSQIHIVYLGQNDLVWRDDS